MTVMADLVVLRKRAGLTQEQLAARMHVDRTTIAKLETGRRSPLLATLQRYATAVGAEITVTVPPPHRDKPVRLRITCNTCVDDEGRPKHWDQTCEDCADEFIEAHAAAFPDHTLTMAGRLPSWP